MSCAVRVASQEREATGRCSSSPGASCSAELAPSQASRARRR